MRLINERRIAAAAAAAVMCITGPVTSASASTPVLHASQHQAAHTCTVIGTDKYGNKGVVCADLNSGIDHYGTPEVDAWVEIICENSSGTVVRCAEAHMEGDLANAAATDPQRGNGDCGHEFVACSAGRNYWVVGSRTFPGLTASNCQSSLSNNIWAYVEGGEGYGEPWTRIELPVSGLWVSLDYSNANDGRNESTGHYYICP